MKIFPTKSVICAFALVSAMAPAASLAAPGDSVQVSGQAQARVIEPVGIQAVQDLRFGAFASPATASTMTIAPDGSATATGDVVNSYNAVAQPPSGRGNAHFAVFGDPNRRYIVFRPNRTTISNGTSTMTVRRYRTDTTVNRFNSSGVDDLRIGATLDIDANQEVGQYTGTFDVTVLYL